MNAEYLPILLCYLDRLETTKEHVVIDRFNYVPLLFVLVCLINKICDDLSVPLAQYQK